MKEPRQLELFPAAAARPEPKLVSPAPACGAALERPARHLESPAQDLESRLRRRLGDRLRRLTLTDNVCTFLSAQRDEEDGAVFLRLQRCFAAAPDPIIDAVATFVSARRRGRRASEALELLRAWFDENGPAYSSPSAALRPQGEVHDLAAIRDSLNARYFDGHVSVAITWGRALSRKARSRKRRRRWSLQLGSFCREERLIRIHRVLDQPHVPRHVVEAVVHHELSHAAVPPDTRAGGRRRLHGPAFLEYERRYPRLDEAARWIDRHLRRLLNEA